MHVLVAHGASGSAASMRAHVEGLARRGIEATAIDLPLRRAEAAVPVFHERVVELDLSADAVVVSGQSYGGRVASLLAAEVPHVCGAVVCFSYPLHRPGAPDWEARSAHWPRITAPMLLLSGEADPFARLDLLRRAVDERAPGASLVTWPRVGHGLRPVLEEALDQVAVFLRGLATAAG